MIESTNDKGVLGWIPANTIFYLENDFTKSFKENESIICLILNKENRTDGMTRFFFEGNVYIAKGIYEIGEFLC